MRRLIVAFYLTLRYLASRYNNPPIVICYFDQSERANVARLRAGQKVTLRCIGAGAENSKVEFRQCKVVN
jgi:hypothetical protein